MPAYTDYRRATSTRRTRTSACERAERVPLQLLERHGGGRCRRSRRTGATCPTTGGRSRPSSRAASGSTRRSGRSSSTSNRQAIGNNYLQQLGRDWTTADRVKTLATMPEVDQTFGGAFSRRHADAGSREPGVRRQDARPVDGGITRGGARRCSRLTTAVSVAAAPDRKRRADPPLAGGRPALRRRARRARRRPRRRARRASRHPRAERRGQDDALQRHRRRVPADGGNDRAVRRGRHDPAGPHARRPRADPHVPDVAALPRPHRSRTTSTSRSWASEGGHLRPVVLRAPRRRAARARPATSPARVGLDRAARLTLVGDLSHGEQRQLEVGMALAGEPTPDDARRARRRALAGRAREAHGAAARPRPRRSRCS